MWLAHAFSLSRIPLALVFWAVVDAPLRALGVVVLAAVTDALDGRIARAIRRRRGGGGSDRTGAWLDPLCDKIFVVIALIAVAVELRPAAWLVAAIGARELVLVPVVAIYRLSGSLRRRVAVPLRAGVMGKVATVAQFFAIAALIAGHRTTAPLAVLAAVTGLVAAGLYIAQGARRLAASRRIAAPVPPRHAG